MRIGCRTGVNKKRMPVKPEHGGMSFLFSDVLVLAVCSCLRPCSRRDIIPPPMHLGTADAEIKVSSVENPGAVKGYLFKAWRSRQE